MKLNDQVPFETFLDVLLVEEIPVENAQSTGIVMANGQEVVRTQRAQRKPTDGIVLSCDVRFPMSGVWVDMPYRPGDVIRTSEFGRDYLVLYPDDEFKVGAKKYYQIRYQDVYGLVTRGHLESPGCYISVEVLKDVRGLKREVERNDINEWGSGGGKVIYPVIAAPESKQQCPNCGDVELFSYHFSGENKFNLPLSRGVFTITPEDSHEA